MSIHNKFNVSQFASISLLIESRIESRAIESCAQVSCMTTLGSSSNVAPANKEAGTARASAAWNASMSVCYEISEYTTPHFCVSLRGSIMSAG